MKVNLFFDTKKNNTNTKKHLKYLCCCHTTNIIKSEKHKQNVGCVNGVNFVTENLITFQHFSHTYINAQRCLHTFADVHCALIKHVLLYNIH